MAFLGCAEKTRRPIVKQCHTDGLLLADKSRILLPFSMVLAVLTEPLVRFPSLAPIFSSANLQFSRPLSCECPATLPDSAKFP